MADIDTAAIRAHYEQPASGYMGVVARPDIHALCDEIDRLRARLAEVEAERDAQGKIGEGLATRLMAVTAERNAAWLDLDNTKNHLEIAEARLAEIEALCKKADPHGDAGVVVYVAPVLAIVRGEGDQPTAVCTCGKPIEHVTADPDSDEWACLAPGPAHERGVVDCPCTSCVDRFLDGQQ